MFFCEKTKMMMILTLSTLLISVNDAADNNKKQDPKCLLPMEPGPCRMSLNRFYYDAKTDTCEEFKFGGCKGNDNKFGFKQTCEAACKKSTATTAATSATKTSGISTTTESEQLINKQLKSDTLKTLTSNAGATSTTTTPKSSSRTIRTTPKTKSSTPRSVTTTTTQKSKRF